MLLVYQFCSPLEVLGTNPIILLVLISFNVDPSLYHFYGLIGNATTIESWEKDKVAVMIRRGKTQEVYSALTLPIICLRLPLGYVSICKYPLK